MSKKNIITVADIQVGDKIKVTHQSGQVKCTYTGVADSVYYGVAPSWYTADSESLGTHVFGAVIELLDRPELSKVRIEPPTGQGAVIEYQRSINGQNYRRVASFIHGAWRVSGASYSTLALRPCPLEGTTEFDFSNAWMRDHLNDDKLTSNFKVLFEGVK